MAKKQQIDYTPKRITETHWSVHNSFITHWLIRGDIQKIEGTNMYKRIIDDKWLKDHLKGHTYETR